MENYENHSHTHCFDQKDPPCGLKGKHRCCLCQKPVADEGKVNTHSDQPFAEMIKILEKAVENNTFVPTPPNPVSSKTNEGWEINWKPLLINKMVNEQIAPRKITRVIEIVEKLFEHILSSERERQIGVSEWIGYGKIFGYDKYLLDTERERVVKMCEGTKKEIADNLLEIMPEQYWRKFGYNQALDDIINKLTSSEDKK